MQQSRQQELAADAFFGFRDDIIQMNSEILEKAKKYITDKKQFDTKQDFLDLLSHLSTITFPKDLSENDKRGFIMTKLLTLSLEEQRADVVKYVLENAEAIEKGCLENVLEQYLSLAVSKLDSHMVQLLLNKGATFNGRTHSIIQDCLNRLKDSATEEKYFAAFEVVKALAGAGAKVNEAINFSYGTPLEVAAKVGAYDVAKWLVEEKKVDVRSSYAIHRAAEKGDVKMMDFLIQNGACVNGKFYDVIQKSSITPLYFAAKGGHLDAVNLLLSKGANPCALFYSPKDKKSETALDVVPEGKKHDELRSILKRHQTTKAYIQDCIKHPGSRPIVTACAATIAFAAAGYCAYKGFKCLPTGVQMSILVVGFIASLTAGSVVNRHPA